MIAQTSAPTSATRAHEELFGYWASLRGDRLLPGRRDLDPEAFKRHLPTISLIDVRREPTDFRIRLAGTGLYSLFGREITGLNLGQVFPALEAKAWHERLNRVVEGKKPCAGVCSLGWRDASRLSLVWMRLPLASDGQNVDMILGYDAIVGLRDDTGSGIRAA